MSPCRCSTFGGPARTDSSSFDPFHVVARLVREARCRDEDALAGTLALKAARERLHIRTADVVLPPLRDLVTAPAPLEGALGEAGAAI